MGALRPLVRLLAIALLLHAAGAEGTADAARRDAGFWRGAPRLKAVLAGAERISVERSRLPDDLDSPGGAGKRGTVDAPRVPDRERSTPLPCAGGFAPGELPTTQAFLRLNGSADAHGKRA